jgi:hypothetical protein
MRIVPRPVRLRIGPDRSRRPAGLSSSDFHVS